MLHSFLVTQSTYRVIFPTSRENICRSGQAKFYVILKVIPSELDWWIQKNDTRWRERLFSLPFFVTEENTLFFLWLKANNQPIPTKLTFFCFFFSVHMTFSSCYPSFFYRTFLENKLNIRATLSWATCDFMGSYHGGCFLKKIEMWSHFTWCF